MRSILALVLLISLSWAATTYAQWESVPLPTDEPIDVYQYDKVLYGISFNTYYRSFDFGKTWSVFNKGLPENLKVHHGFVGMNGDVYIYAPPYYNTPEPGLEHVYYYCSKGDTQWSARSISPIHGQYPNPSNVTFWGKDTVIALLDTLFFSADGGVTWEARISGAMPRLNGYGILHCGKRLYSCAITHDTATRHYYYHWSYSDDFSKSWIPMITPLADSPDVFFHVVSDSVIIIGSRESSSYTQDDRTYWRSIDKGKSWEQIFFPDRKSNTSFVRAIASDNILSVCFETYYPDVSRYLNYISRDYGHSWKPMPFDDSIKVIPYVYGHDNELFIRRRMDIIKTDSNFSRKGLALVPTGYVLPMTLLGATGPLLFTSNKNNLYNFRDEIDSIFYSSDNGSSWQKRVFVSGFKTWASAVWYKDGRDFYTVARDAAKGNVWLMHSTDVGQSWVPSEVGPSDGSLTSFYRVVYLQGDTVFLSRSVTRGDYNDILRSLDKGQTWKVLHNTPLWGSLSITSTPEGIHFIDAYNRYTSVNLGDTLLPDPPITQAHLLDNNYFFVVGKKWFVSSYAPDSLWNADYINTCSFDDGASWRPTPISELRSAFNVTLFDGNTLFGIAYSFDDVNDPHEGRPYKSYFSLDTGISWKAVPGGFYGSLSLTSTPEYLYAWGTGGLWRYKMGDLSIPKKALANNTSQLLAYPNPIGSAVFEQISYELNATSNVRLTIEDSKGATVAILVDVAQSPGVHRYNWNTGSVAAGTYILHLQAGGESSTVRIQVLK